LETSKAELVLKVQLEQLGLLAQQGRQQLLLLETL
jgi:hypothetical protein